MESDDPVDSLILSCSNLRLHGKEQRLVTVSESDLEELLTGGKPALMGKLFTHRPYRKLALFSHLRSMWCLDGWAKFREAWDDAFLIIFEKQEDQHKVLTDGPWLFSKHILLLQEVEDKIIRGDVHLHIVSLWVHLIGFPPLGHTVSMREKIGSQLGTVLEVDTKRRSTWKGGLKGASYMRIRTMFDISHPLLRGIMLSEGHDQRRWVSFRYERLPNFCFCCGRLGHVNKECDASLGNKDAVHQYGDWLQSSSDLSSPFDSAMPTRNSNNVHKTISPMGDGEAVPDKGKSPATGIPKTAPTSLHNNFGIKTGYHMNFGPAQQKPPMGGYQVNNIQLPTRLNNSMVNLWGGSVLMAENITQQLFGDTLHTICSRPISNWAGDDGNEDRSPKASLNDLAIDGPEVFSANVAPIVNGPNRVIPNVASDSKIGVNNLAQVDMLPFDQIKPTSEDHDLYIPLSALKTKPRSCALSSSPKSQTAEH